MERLIDTAAAEMDIDRLELRRRNQIKPREFPYKTASGMTYDSGDFPALTKQAVEVADAKGFARRKRESRSAASCAGSASAASSRSPPRRRRRWATSSSSPTAA